LLHELVVSLPKMVLRVICGFTICRYRHKIEIISL